MSAHWPHLCRERARALGLPDAATAPLAAFAGGDERPAADFAALLRDSASLAAALPARIRDALAGEVDPAQGAMFARRFAGVRDRLAASAAPEAPLLQVGLAQRAAEVLAGPAPRALRVRAVADFYYSHAALLHHRQRRAGAPAPRLVDHVAAARWREVAPGIRWARLAGDTDGGPIHVNALRLRGARVLALDCRDQGSLPEIVAARGADAAVSGGFFLYSEPDIVPPSRRTDPVGLVLSDGALVSPPIWTRSALIQRADGQIAIDAVGMGGATLRWPGGALQITAVNDPTAIDQDPPGCAAFNRAFGERAPTAPGIALVGDRVVAAGDGLPIPLAGCVVVSRGPRPPIGPVQIDLPLDARDAMAGGPRLLAGGQIQLDLAAEQFAGSAPPITFSRDETFDQNLLPRMAAGLTPDGELVLVAIDGRNFHAALGMTLRQTATLCAALGCTEAMNLDGGSSKRMVVDEAVVDLPSTEVVSVGASARVRPVHSGLLFFSRA